MRRDDAFLVRRDVPQTDRAAGTVEPNLPALVERRIGVDTKPCEGIADARSDPRLVRASYRRAFQSALPVAPREMPDAETLAMEAARFLAPETVEDGT